MRLIDADAAKTRLYKLGQRAKDMNVMDAVYRFFGFLNNCPTAIDVVYCKDCGHKLKDGFCQNEGCYVDDDWFCADGERRANDV